MQFNTEKYGYNKREVDEYLKKLSCDVETLSKEQNATIQSLKKEIEEKSIELLKYKKQDESISEALVAAVETAKQIEENSKNIYELEIRRIRSLYDKWQSYLDEMMDRYPEMKEHFDPSSITDAFKKGIDEVLATNDDDRKKNNIGIRNLISKMNGAQRAEFQKTYTLSSVQKPVKRRAKPSIEAVNKKIMNDSLSSEKLRLRNAGLQTKQEKVNDYNSLAEQFLNEEISENLEQTAYSKSILQKKKESGFDLKEALTPTEDLMDIMKAFNIDND